MSDPKADLELDVLEDEAELQSQYDQAVREGVQLWLRGKAVINLDSDTVLRIAIEETT